MNLPNNVILLFYQDFERDSVLPYDRYLKRVLRPVYHRWSKGPKVSGFLVWYQLLVKALREHGYDVRLNDYAFARKHPAQPVGLIGYPSLLDRWRLPNPALIGPGFFDHPSQAPELMRDPRYRRYIVTCAWMEQMFKPLYGDRCVRWHAGMDIAAWPDTRDHAKGIDVLVYDKIRWQRPVYESILLQPILDALDRRGLRHHTIRYRQYDHATYKTLLSQSRSMIFVCEHETQGMAYQEALASNVPILAWDNGWWLDPDRARFEADPVPASSVPYWSAECGERFADQTAFEPTFDRFWTKLTAYQPRRFVERELSFASSAATYAQHYAAIAAGA